MSAERRLVLLASVLIVATMSARVEAVTPADPYATVVAFPTRTGHRAVIAWQGVRQVDTEVRWGYAADALNNTVTHVPAEAGVMFIERVEQGERVWFQLVDRSTGDVSAVRSLRAENAYTAWQGMGYVVNLVVAVDAAAAPDGLPHDQSIADIVRAVDVMAERVYDALDGWARIGRVLVIDGTSGYALNPPAYPTVCGQFGGLSDVIFQASVPTDSHTVPGFAIDQPCAQIYLGRLGWTATPWGDHLDVGAVLAHEMIHYAFNARDLYRPARDAECDNPVWDGSIMSGLRWDAANGRWYGTELDRNPELTPCDHGKEPWSWDNLRERYIRIPELREGPVEHIVDSLPQGNADGGDLEVWTLEQTLAGMELKRAL